MTTAVGRPLFVLDPPILQDEEAEPSNIPAEQSRVLR